MVDKRSRFCLLVGLMSLLLALACQAPPVPTATTAESPAPPTASPLGGLYFPRHHLGPDDPRPDALVTGRVQLVGECIVLQTESGTTVLPLWPPDFQLANNQAPLILDGSGRVVPFGRLITLGGGEFPATRFLDLTPPPECSLDLVWLVTELVEQR